ncbi:MAG: hypothetical protein Q8O86_06745 [Dehalococcoidia bacterium]|nr:hypothetical protein [Dehalococcoidia bacterium]
MEHQEILDGLAQIRQIARRLQAGTDIPTLERTLRTIDTYCHMMQWQLGGTDQLLPELSAAESHQ